MMQKMPAYDLSRFQETARNHPLWQHEFLKRCQTGQLTQPEVVALATQMYKFCKKFNRILISILYRCQDEAVRVVIAENLYEELGEGDPERTHPALFRNFTRALGIDDDTLEATPTEPETANMIDAYFEMANRYGFLAALGGVCFASEGIAGDLYCQFQQGILSTATFPPGALEYFDLHIGTDDSHAETFARVIASRVNTPEDAEMVCRAIRDGLDARMGFLDGVQRRARLLAAADKTFSMA